MIHNEMYIVKHLTNLKKDQNHSWEKLFPVPKPDKASETQLFGAHTSKTS